MSQIPPETAILTRFISQKCLRYDPKTNRDEWYMVAEFSDGRIYQTTVLLKQNIEEHIDIKRWRLKEETQ